ncbi:putative tubulin--tyrosine ligase PBY1 [Lasiodiplodia hormozganensis]|uniref:Tubulin--tyrosine ligase PBY1 n=1 Tax=Lasiodiplodia hormozganensis TaxID=869390 RepID=A0AA40CMQ2_9PEZI|nr:putative tubulin--tyrosine ligase PBY1 [Lasiodiplodia hormozganensis]
MKAPIETMIDIRTYAGTVTNDDGPPSDPSSPYVQPLVSTLESHGHRVSVILPSTQRSWIGKAHIITDIHTTTAFHPAPSSSGSPHPRSTWTLVNGTPASCIQLGLNNHQAGADTATPIDLVLSGPNFGKNTTAVFALSSGTIGAAMEAALCGKKAIAVSFAHAEDGTYDVAEACEHAVKLAEHLHGTWDEDVHVYSVNVPLGGGERGDGEDGGKRRRVVWTRVQQNGWGRDRAFREREGKAGDKGFEWAPPKFGDVTEGIAASVAPEDSWAIRNGFTR